MNSERVFSQHLPRLTMGWGAREQLPALLRLWGRRVLVVTDPGVAAVPLFAQTMAALADKGLETHQVEEISPDPPLEEFRRCGASAREFAPSVVLGIGGGSALDVTKIASVLAKHDLPLETLFGIDQVPARGLPTVLVPTTAGTGSEVTPIAVASDVEAEVKRGIVSDYLVADYAVIDPELCVSLPPGPTAYTGMDALTHAIEAYTNRFAVPLIDAYALEAIRLIAAHLERAFRNGSDAAARSAMSRASLLGGFCLGPVNTAAVHALAYPLGGRFKVPHGVANSLLLPHVMQFNLAAVGDRYQDVARAMGATDAVQAVAQLAAAVGTNARIRDFGVATDELPALAEAAVGVKRLMVNNPREVSVEDALAIYHSAF